tara:strand:+ start:14591 stop:14767 length:177 start_codon:yes stop_codon:yes gene_type:complete
MSTDKKEVVKEIHITEQHKQALNVVLNTLETPLIKLGLNYKDLAVIAQCKHILEPLIK